VELFTITGVAESPCAGSPDTSALVAPNTTTSPDARRALRVPCSDTEIRERPCAEDGCLMNEACRHASRTVMLAPTVVVV
jgi:hypothetical protein